MKTPRRSLMSLLVVVILMAACLLAGAWYARDRSSLLPPRKIDETVTLSLLRSEALSFLVTRRTSTQIVVEHNESDWLGEWHGVLWATVSWRWGVDLTKIGKDDLRREGDVIYCRLAEPELLDFSVDLDSIKFLSKSTAVPKVMDMMGGGAQRRQLEQSLHQRAMEFARQQKLCPSRQDMVNQLNGAGEALKKATGLELRFE